MPIIHMGDEAARGVGTCFAITNNGVCLTARHVLEDAFPAPFNERRNPIEADGRLFALYVRPPDDPHARQLFGGLLPVRQCSFMHGLDIAVLHLNLPVSANTGKQIEVLANRLGLGVPSVGQGCMAFGYHAMEWELADQRTVRQSLSATRGTVEEIHIPRRDRYSLTFPCFRTSARYDGGMSGGPVFTDDGFVRGVVCSSMRLDDGDGTHILYASLIAPSMLLAIDARKEEGGPAAKHFLWDFIQSGAAKADQTGARVEVEDGLCRVSFGGIEMRHRIPAKNGGA